MRIILLVFKIEGNIPENKDWWKRIASWSEMREVIIIFFLENLMEVLLKPLAMSDGLVIVSLLTVITVGKKMVKIIRRYHFLYSSPHIF